MATGFRSRSDAPPVACSVDEPSNDQTGASFSLPLKSSTTFVLLRRPWVGLEPSSQMYSSFAFVPIFGGSPFGGLRSVN